MDNRQMRYEVAALGARPPELDHGELAVRQAADHT